MFSVLLAAVIVPPWAAGAQYYVSPSGTADVDGSPDKPFSASHVAQNVPLQPGDEEVKD